MRVTGGLIVICLLLPTQVLGAGSRSSVSRSLVAQDSQSATAVPRGASSLERAKALALAQRWSKAEATARAYLKDNPDSFEAHALLGLILHNEHNPKASMVEYVEANKLSDLSALDLKMFALDCASLHNFEAAEKWLARSLQINPKDWQGWDALGHMRFEVQRYDSAIEAFQECLRLKPNTISAQTGIGLAYEASSRSDEAIKAYRLAIQWESEHFSRDYVPFLGLGRTLLSQDKPMDAIQPLKESVRLAPNEPLAHQVLGKAYFASEEFSLAQTQLEEAVRLDSQNADAHFLLAQVYRKLGLNEHAKSELERYTALKKDR